MKHQSMTKDQFEILNQDLEKIMQGLSDIANLLHARYGDEDPRVARAEESQAALQRLLWALERQGQLPMVGNAAASARVRQILQLNVKADQ
jgi:hypothetical protein